MVDLALHLAELMINAISLYSTETDGKLRAYFWWVALESNTVCCHPICSGR